MEVTVLLFINFALGNKEVISSTFWTPQFRNKYLPYKLHYYFLSRSGSARNKRIKNATGTDFEVKDATQFMDFTVFESAPGDKGMVSSTIWTH